MNYTKKEDSIRLEELGYSSSDFHSVGGHETSGAVPRGQWVEEYKAYDSDQLFEWLREWRIPTKRWFAIEGQFMYVYLEDGDCEELEIQTNLTDMLAKAVIWILEQ